MADKIIGIDYSIRSPAISVVHEPQFPESDFWYSCYYRTTKHSNMHTIMCSSDDNKQRRKLGKRSYNFCIRGYPDEPLSGFKRYTQLADWTGKVVEWAQDPPHNLIVGFEGASYGSPGKVVQLAENVGAAKVAASRYCSNLYDIPPQSVKRFATGNGRAEKIDMYNAFVKETGVDLLKYFDCGAEGNPLSDIIDSFWITQYIIHNKEALIQSLDPSVKKTRKKKRRTKRRQKAV